MKPVRDEPIVLDPTRGLTPRMLEALKLLLRAESENRKIGTSRSGDGRHLISGATAAALERRGMARTAMADYWTYVKLTDRGRRITTKLVAEGKL